MTVKIAEKSPLIIDIPVDCYSNKVKVTIDFVKNRTEVKSTLQDILLEAPTLIDDALEEYSSIREWMGQWKIN